ncbi:S9 family peptidase [Methylosinus sp. H3A]|uniref:S9 family peptidase n=1 Tax=Methylosinus sp. H3A TaxID=2785786 RepID=UPI0018C22CAD|nr:S9 family peptidase [Methylosinus sp. H3A]MBG0812096.1 S9 family peptidase [Methylosinus sp. H3A]
MADELIPRAHLFGNPKKAAARLSPDGRLLAWLQPDEGVLNIFVAPLEGLDAARAVTKDRKRGVRIFSWAYDGRSLLYMQDEGGNENFHVFVVDAEGGEARDLTPFDGVAARIGKISRKIRDRVILSVNRRDKRFHDVYAVTLATGELSLVQENPGYAGFILDDEYRPRLALRNTPDGRSEILRSEGGAWAPWIVFDAADARSSSPLHLDAEAKTLFLRDSRNRDKAALVRVDLASGATTLVAESDKADIGHVITDRESYLPLAYGVERERLEYFALDDRIRADIDFLNARDIGDWGIASRTEDDSLWVVSAASDTSPSVDHLYDRRAKTLRILHRARPELVGAPLRPMRPVTIKSRDGLDLVCYLTLPKAAEAKAPQPMVLLVHGGPWSRGSFGYDAQHQWLANRGYAVLSVNFRSSTGLGKAFVNAGDHEWGRRMDDDLLDAVDWAIRQGIADMSRIAIMGGSYGGYATLVGLTRNPQLYACGVDIVGPSNLETLLATIPPYWESFRAQLVKAIGDPATEEGRALLRERSPLYHADRLAKPLLIAQGANDPRVKQAEAEQMVAALESKKIPVAYLLYPNEGHGFARPENSLSFHAIAENFLARHLGGRAEPVRAEELKESSLRIEKGASELALP